MTCNTNRPPSLFGDHLTMRSDRSAFATPAAFRLSSISHRQTCALSSFRGLSLNTTRRARHASLRMCQSTESSPPSESKRPFRDLSPEVKELRSVLRKCSVYLIGPMGSGKSVVGKYLAYEIGFRFLDIDELIEQVAQRTINEIFEADGEEAFRDLESAVLDQVTPFIGCVIATGGGAVLRKENWGKLQTGIVVYLNVQPDVLFDRLQGETKENRPLLKGAEAESLQNRLNAILDERRHLYEEADVIVPVHEEQCVDDVGKNIIRLLTNFIKANPPRLSALYPSNLPKKS